MKNNGTAVQIKKWTKFGEADSNNIKEWVISSFIIATNDKIIYKLTQAQETKISIGLRFHIFSSIQVIV